MSVEALKWAFEQEDVKPGPRFVLVALANRADEEGVAFPSIRWLKKKTGLPESNIRKYISELCEIGKLRKAERRREDGGRSSNEYQLALVQPGLALGDPPPVTGRGSTAIARPPRPQLAGVPPATGGHETKDQTKELKKPMRGSPLPENFGISPAIREWARKQGWEPYLELHLGQLQDYALGGTREGKVVVALNWDAKFRSCIRSDWGDVRMKAQREARVNQRTGQDAGAPKVRTCVGCSSPKVVGSVGGRWHCMDRTCKDKAMYHGDEVRAA